jgi:hypothetical protein
MNKFMLYSAALFAIGTSTVVQAATVVTGGRCTERQKSNKLTSCETSTFTNNAGQTGYKCTCTDKFVVLSPDRDPSVRSSNPTNAANTAAIQPR